VLLAGTVVALFAAGCGSTDFANKPRPPVRIELTASIGPRAVKVSPVKVGAGPANFTIANLSSNPATLRLSGPTQAATQTLAPQSPTNLSLDLKTGDYTVSAPGSGFRSAKLTVGHERPSSQNKLLLP
jgi:hypothetical protein